MIPFSASISLFSFYLDDVSVGENGVPKSSTFPVGESVCDFSCSSVSFMNMGALVFGP